MKPYIRKHGSRSVLSAVFLLLLLFAGCGKNTGEPEKSAACGENGHEPESFAAVTPTCTEEGREAGERCGKCGVILSGGAVLPAGGHCFALSAVCDGKEGGVPEGVFSCSVCGETVTEALTPGNLGMPILSLTGDITGISKEDKKTVRAEYASADMTFTADAVMKVQGSSSAYYPKKNFNITLYESGSDKKFKTELREGWGKESKYCLKANYIDVSQARNIVSARLYGEIAHDRERGDGLDSLVNAGAIDGFPILLCLNGKPYGLYTLNIPKDNWMFGMKKGEGKQALLFGNEWSESTALKKRIGPDPGADGWELEFCSTEEDPEIGTDWVYESFNRVIDFLAENQGEAFVQGIGDYIDTERAIDVMLYTQFICGADNSGKNIIWVTFDGEKWFPSVYDLDATWGLVYHGREYYAPDESAGFVNDKRLWTKLYGYFGGEIRERYLSLRENILSEEHINEVFSAFFDGIPDALYEMDGRLWQDMPGQDTNNYETIRQWVSGRIAYMDAYIAEKCG